MKRMLVYNCSGELDDLSHLFPNERLARIAAIIRAEGYHADLIDRANFSDLQRFGAEFLTLLGELPFAGTHPSYEARLREEVDALLANDYQLIFLNLWHGTGFKFSMDLARLLKAARPDVPIFGVGQKIDWFKEAILTFAGNGLDGLVTGLGYNAVRAIVRNEAGTSCPNTIMRVNGTVVENPREVLRVDDYPSGDFSPEVYHGIAEKLPIQPITLSNQACPNSCIFCVRPQNYGQVNRRRSVNNVVEEMLEAYTERGIRHFRFDDSTPPPLAMTDLARALLRSELAGRITFSGFARVDTNSEEDFFMLRDAGCLALFFGVESLDDGNLRRLEKGTTYHAVLDTIRRAHAAGIVTVSSFIMPMPGETRHSMQTTLERIADNREIFDSVLALPAGIYPPTAWARHPEKYGVALDDDYLERFVTFPIRYLLPAHYWPVPPFRYAVMGKSLEDTTFNDIIAVYEEFQRIIQRDIGIPCIPDYYYLAADYLGMNPAECTRRIINGMIARDYAGIAHLFSADRGLAIR